MSLKDLALEFNEVFADEDLGDFRIRDIDVNSFKRQVALDFKSIYDGVTVQKKIDGVDFVTSDGSSNFIIAHIRNGVDQPKPGTELVISAKKKSKPPVDNVQDSLDNIDLDTKTLTTSKRRKRRGKKSPSSCNSCDQAKPSESQICEDNLKEYKKSSIKRSKSRSCEKYCAIENKKSRSCSPRTRSREKYSSKSKFNFTKALDSKQKTSTEKRKSLYRKEDELRLNSEMQYKKKQAIEDVVFELELLLRQENNTITNADKIFLTDLVKEIVKSRVKNLDVKDGMTVSEIVTCYRSHYSKEDDWTLIRNLAGDCTSMDKVTSTVIADSKDDLPDLLLQNDKFWLEVDEVLNGVDIDLLQADLESNEVDDDETVKLNTVIEVTTPEPMISKCIMKEDDVATANVYSNHNNDVTNNKDKIMTPVTTVKYEGMTSNNNSNSTSQRYTNNINDQFNIMMLESIIPKPIKEEKTTVSIDSTNRIKTVTRFPSSIIKQKNKKKLKVRRPKAIKTSTKVSTISEQSMQSELKTSCNQKEQSNNEEQKTKINNRGPPVKPRALFGTPTYVLMRPLKKIIKNEFGEDKSMVNITKKLLHYRFKELLKDKVKDDVRPRHIIKMYRQTYAEENRKDFLTRIAADIKTGKYDDKIKNNDTLEAQSTLEK